VVETLGPCPLLQMHQSDQSPYPVAIPETPLRTLEFIQGMAANPTIGESVDAFRDLLKIRKSHGDVEPIQHVLSFGRNLLLDGSQTDIPIGKNCDRGGFGDSALPHGKIDRAHCLGTSITHEGKTGGIALAWRTLPVTTSKFRSGRGCRFLTYPPSKPTTNSFAGSFDEEEARTSADSRSRLPTFIVRLRTVLGSLGKTRARARRGNLPPFQTATTLPSWL